MSSGLLSLLFLLSGAASLVYETLWIRVLSLGVGSTTRAMSLVLALFFLGMSAGSFWAGRYRGRLAPIRLYGLLEGALGLYGALVLFPLLHFPRLSGWLPFTDLSQFLVVALLLTPATVAMGATLPLLVRTLPTLAGRDGVSHWYAVNTFGAVAGTLAASFVLLPRFGVVGANGVAVLLNLIVAVAALRAPARLLPVAEPPPSTPFVPGRREATLIALTALCGFASLVAEVVWNKYLGIFLGNNVYGLGLVLSTYLFGLAAGAWACRYWLAGTRRPATWLVVLLAAAGVLTALTTSLLNGLPVVTHLVGYWLSRGSESGLSLLGLKCLFGTLALLPATLCYGALFPLTVKLLSPSTGEASRAVAWAYSANTLGAIAGSYLAGITFIPLWGSSATIQGASLLLLIGALGALLGLGGLGRRWALAAVPAAVLVLAIRFDFANIVKSAYSQRIEPGTTLSQNLRYFTPQYEEFVWIKEGETSLITLSHDPKDGPSYRDYLRLKTNGLNESIYPLKHLGELPRYEALLGLLPYAFSKAPRRAFVVGYGGGFTVDLLTSLPLAKVRVVELEQAILDAAHRAHGGKNPVFRRANLDLSVEDARYVLARGEGRWDIIVSQPSQSWLAGAANLFTREFFEIVRSNLSESGVYSQWLNLYNMDTEVLRSILRTFYGVFPHGAVFSGEGDQEMILIGSRKPLEANEAELQRLAGLSRFGRKLAAVPFGGPADLLSHFMMSREKAVEASAGAPWNTDRNAFAETRQSRLFYGGVPPTDSPQAFLTARYEPAPSRYLGANRDYEILLSLHQTGQHQKFYRLLDLYDAAPAPTADSLARLGHLYLKAQRYESAREALARALSLEPSTANLNLYLSALAELERPVDLLAETARRRALRDRITECYEAAARLKLGRLAEARPLLRAMARAVPAYTDACGDYFNRLMGDFYFQERLFAVAIPFYETYQAAFDADVEVNRRLAAAYLEEQRWEDAARAAELVRDSARRVREQIAATAAYYEEKRLSADAEVLRRRLPPAAE